MFQRHTSLSFWIHESPLHWHQRIHWTFNHWWMFPKKLSIICLKKNSVTASRVDEFTEQISILSLNESKVWSALWADYRSHEQQRATNNQKVSLGTRWINTDFLWWIDTPNREYTQHHPELCCITEHFFRIKFTEHFFESKNISWIWSKFQWDRSIKASFAGHLLFTAMPRADWTSGEVFDWIGTNSHNHNDTENPLRSWRFMRHKHVGINS